MLDDRVAELERANAELQRELDERTCELKETLDQPTAMSEIRRYHIGRTTRRALFTGVAAALAPRPLVAQAQSRRLGVLMGGSNVSDGQTRAAAFIRGLGALDWREYSDWQARPKVRTAPWAKSKPNNWRDSFGITSSKARRNC